MTEMRNSRGRRKEDRELEVQYELMKVIAEHNKEQLFEYDIEEDCARIYGIKNGVPVEAFVYQDCFKNQKQYLDRLNSKDAKSIKNAIETCAKKDSHQIIDIKCPIKNGGKEWYRFYFASICDLDGEIKSVAGRIVSIQRDKMAEEGYKHRAERDALTGVYNHMTFEQKCEEKLKETDSEVLFLMMDVDDFKLINDSLGHNVGDNVLSQTGDTLNRMLDERGFAGRLGGDEFATIAWGFDSHAEIEQFVSDLRLELKKIIFDMEYSASIGAAVRMGRNMVFKDLYYEADQAVYAAKKNGKNQFFFYSDIIDNLKNEQKEKKTVKIVETGDKLVEVLEVGYEETIVNEREDYVIIVDPIEGSIVYVNTAARAEIIISDDELDSLIGVGLKDKYIEFKNIHNDSGEMYRITKGEDVPNSIICKLFGKRMFIVQMNQGEWNDRKATYISLVDMNNTSQLNSVMKHKTNVQNAVVKCLEYVENGDVDVNYEKSLHLLCELYSADCVAIVHMEDGHYFKAEEVHKPNANIMSKLVIDAAEQGNLDCFDELFDQNGKCIIGNTSIIKALEPVLYSRMTDCRVWSVMATRLKRGLDNEGALIVLNPRQNIADMNVMNFISAYITNDIIKNKLEKKYFYNRIHDSLTGLYNRDSFISLKDSLEDNEYESMGVFVTDILELKRANEKMGYHEGNRLLIRVAEILKSVFSGYRIFRFEDDEMIVFCDNVTQTEFSLMARLAKEKVDELNFPVISGFSWTNHLNIMGIVKDAEDMISVTKRQMNRRTYNPRFAQSVASELGQKISAGDFIMYLQPKVNLKTGETVGAEALARMKVGNRIVGPLHFVSRLEEQDAVHFVDLFIFEEACKFVRRCIDENKKAIPVSVNFSKRTLIYSGLLEKVRNLLVKYDISPEYIEIEITEGAGDMDHLAVSSASNSLTAMGFPIAMDDFGTQYSNMAMLSQYHFDIAKIDRSLVAQITENEKSRVVLKNLVSMIKEMGIKCVIEGAETKEQIDILKGMECEVIQGYYYSKPISIEEFDDKFLA